MTCPSPSLPGWFGKLPGAGDFAHRRMPHGLRTAWDDWLHDGLADLRIRHQGWVNSYLTSPVWGFLLGPGVVTDDTAWVGAMAPSVDRIGRYYPIALFTTLSDSPSPSPWWKAAQQVLLRALDDDANAEYFDQLIAAAFAPDALVPAAADDAAGSPGPRRSLWVPISTPDASPAMEVHGLPTGPMFDRLFDMHPAAANVEGGG